MFLLFTGELSAAQKECLHAQSWHLAVLDLRVQRDEQLTLGLSQLLDSQRSIFFKQVDRAVISIEQPLVAHGDREERVR